MQARSFIVALLCLFSTPTFAAPQLRDYLKKPGDWYGSVEAIQMANNILSYQSPLGSWPKNTDTFSTRYTGDMAKLEGTFDNRATLDELRFLARVYGATKEERYKQSFLKGFNHILQAQYANGGWPQHYPPGKGYNRYITFNDDAMVRLMQFVREVVEQKEYDFLSAEQRQTAQQSFDRGIECILKCQIKVNGKLTAWCAQHDEKDYSPRPARTFELTSLSGYETVGIVRLLMSLDKPSPEVVQAIQSAVAWLESVKIPGIKLVKQEDKNTEKGYDTVVVQEPAAPPMWARFYEIGTNKPIFSSRDGVAKSSLAEISYERRNGYAWLGSWPQSLLTKEYPVWKAKWAERIRNASE